MKVCPEPIARTLRAPNLAARFQIPRCLSFSNSLKGPAKLVEPEEQPWPGLRRSGHIVALCAPASFHSFGASDLSRNSSSAPSGRPPRLSS